MSLYQFVIDFTADVAIFQALCRIIGCS